MAKAFIDYKLSGWRASIKKCYCNYCYNAVNTEDGFFKLAIDYRKDYYYSSDVFIYLCPKCFDIFKNDIINKPKPDLKKEYSEKVKLGIVNKLERSNTKHG